MKKVLIIFLMVLLLPLLRADFTPFYNSFEDSSETGITGFNSTKWDATEQGDGNDVSVSTAHVYGGTYAANLQGEAGVSESALKINLSFLDLSGYSSCTLRFWFYIGGNQGTDDFLYTDIYDGSWHYAVDTIVGEDFDSGDAAWRERTVSLSSYNTTTNFSVRFDAESSPDNNEYFIDNVNITCTSFNSASPVISNISASHSTIKGGTTLTIYANTSTHGVNDTDQTILYLYCDNSTSPTSANTDCTGGTTSDSNYPYTMTCSFLVPSDNINYTEYCRIYDGNYYSSTVNLSYITDSTPLSLSIISVAGDSDSSYFDSNDDGLTDVILSGESNMNCRWSSSDLSYSSMTTGCTISGTQANCSLNDIGSQGFYTRYISCQDAQGNEHTSGINLHVQFYLDYTAPTTSDDSTSNIQVPSYIVTLTESDNVDSDPTTYYCTDTTNTCSPSTIIDNGGTITFTSSNRGINYLRYNSTDDAGNKQSVVSKTININKLPIFTSASDDATTLQGGRTVNVSVSAYDADSGTNVTLFVCNSTGASLAGCSDGHYCNATGNNSISCTFASESDSQVHSWYAYVFDVVGEGASANPKSGSYTTDSAGPIIALVSPFNNSNITQSSFTVQINLNEELTNSWYNLNNNNNVSMQNTSILTYAKANSSITDGIYNLSIWANDSLGNIASLTGISFTIDSTGNDTTPPTITLWSPLNNTYDLDGTILINITTDEALIWAGYTNNSGPLTNLYNYTTTNWNATISLTEGQHNLTIFANDSSTNRNQANKSITIYVDLTNPKVESLDCPNVNDSETVICYINVTDLIGLSHAIISWNSSNSWQNSSNISLSGKSVNTTYTITSTNTTPGSFGVYVYLYDISGRTNLTESAIITISDDTFPTMFNITYSPNTTDELDPGINIKVNVTIFEDYSIADVYFMYRNSSTSAWSFINMSNLTAIQSNASIIYNTSLTLTNETWYFKINATDSAGNQNISQTYTLTVTNDTTHNITTTIPSVKSFYYSQRSNNNSLGRLFMNNTGDNSLSFNVTLSSSSIQQRLSINDTGTRLQNFSGVSSGQAVNISINVNTTSLTSGIYNYTIEIVSEAGTETFERQLNLQTSAGPYLVTTITTYSQNVTKGQTGVQLIAKVENLGSQDAQNTFLNWTLPSEFTITSGSQNRNLGNIPIGSQGTNTITISVDSDSDDKIVNITATGTASSADQSSNSRQITIGSPSTTTLTVTTTTSGGGGGGGTSKGTSGIETEAVSYDVIKEVVRGEKDYFYIEVENKNKNFDLQNLEITLTGFPEQHIKITPEKILSIQPNKKESFKVDIISPTYLYYKVFNLKAVIKGKIKTGTSSKSYIETQRIKLIVQEISREKAEENFDEAGNAIIRMKEKSFNTVEVTRLLNEADNRLNQRRNNKESYDLSSRILELEKTALESNDLLRKLVEAMKNPRKSNLIVGNIINDFGAYDEITPLNEFLSITTKFSSESSFEVLSLGIAAFQRGDYELALQRAKESRTLLLLERKGNFFLFMYLYWHIIIITSFILLICIILGFKQYKKIRISTRIKEINKEEKNISDLIKESQELYFSGKISADGYHSSLEHNQKKLSKIRNKRIELRNIRINLLKPRVIEKELDDERKEIEESIKNIQRLYYKEHKITPKEYEEEFGMLNKRLAEIEGEGTTIHLTKQKNYKNNHHKAPDKINQEDNKKTKEVVVVRKKLRRNLKRTAEKIKKSLEKVSLSLKKISKLFKIKNKKARIEHNIFLGSIMEKLKGINCKNKYIKINLKEDKDE